MSSLKPSMCLDLLPENAMFNILSRLPVKTIIHCKCVCKKWLDFITDSYFVNLHLSNSPTGYIVLHYPEYEYMAMPNPGILRLVDIVNELDHCQLRHDPIMHLDLDLARVFQDSQTYVVGSMNGLVCLLDYSRFRKVTTYICNPITREYMILPDPEHYARGPMICYGFGISSLSGEYKVVRVFHDYDLEHPNAMPHLPIVAEVYTVSSCQWRSLGQVTYILDGYTGPFMNNHVHWIVYEVQNSAERIYTFDFDNETFQLFPSPPVVIEEYMVCYERLGVLKGCLCYSYRDDLEVSVWVMKEYGIKNSWIKEVSIKERTSPNLYWSFQTPLVPIGSLNNGSILMSYDFKKLLVYHPDMDIYEETEFVD